MEGRDLYVFSDHLSFSSPSVLIFVHGDLIMDQGYRSARGAHKCTEALVMALLRHITRATARARHHFWPAQELLQATSQAGVFTALQGFCGISHRHRHRHTTLSPQQFSLCQGTQTHRAGMGSGHFSVQAKCGTQQESTHCK